MEEEKIIEQALNNNEEAKNELYLKYKYIVDIFIRKYYNIATFLNIDLHELEGEAYLSFSDAINSYHKDKNAKLSTFISLCVDRQIKKVLKKYSTEKARALNNTYSLDYDYNEEGTTLKDLIQDERIDDPLNTIESKENYEELITKIKDSLSSFEYEVFEFYINGFDYQTIATLTEKEPKQIDNTIQRLKHKIKDILKN